MANNIQAGVEINAEVAGINNIQRLSNEIEAVGGDASVLRQRSQELASTFNELSSKNALITQFRELKAQTTQVGSAFAQAQQKVQDLAIQMQQNPSPQLSAQFETARKAAKKLKEQHQQLQQQLQQTRNAMTQAGLSTSNLAAQQSQLSAQADQARDELEELTTQANALKQLANDRVRLGLDVDDRAEREIEELTQSYERLRDGGTLTTAELARATERYEQRLRQLRGQANQVPSSLNPIASSIQRIGKQAMAIAGVTIGFDMLRNSIQSVLEKTQEFDAIQKRFNYAFGGVEEGGRQFEYVKNAANALGLEMMGAANGYSQLASATKDLNMTQAQTQQTFGGVATAAAAMNLSADETSAVFLALSQIAGKGKVSMEELRGQLGERLTPAMGIAAQSMGVTTAELEKMVESGISAEDFLPKFGAALEQVFTGEAAGNAATLNGQINTLKNQFNEMLNSMGQGGVADAAITVMQDIGDMMRWLEVQMASSSLTGSYQDQIVSAYEAIKELAQGVYDIFSTVTEQIDTTISAFTGLGDTADTEFSLMKASIEAGNVLLGAFRDGIEVVKISIDLLAGAASKRFAQIANGLAKITFGDLSKSFADAAEKLEADATQHFGKAQDAAMVFESKSAEAARRMTETQTERFERLERESKAAYQQASDEAIKAAKIAQEAQQQANAAIGTDAEETAAKQASEANKAANAARVSAVRAEKDWTQAHQNIGGTAEEVTKITEPMRQAGLTSQTTAKQLQEVSQSLADAKGAALGLGLNLRGAGSQVNPALDLVTEKVVKLQTGFNELENSGVNASWLVREAMGQMLETAVNPADIEAVKQKWREFGESGSMSAKEVENGLIQAEVRLQDLKNTLIPLDVAFQNTTTNASAISQALIGAKAAAQTLGMDVNTAMSTPSVTMLEAALNAEKLKLGFDDLKASGADAGVVMREAVNALLQVAKSEADINMAKAKIKEFGREGALSARDVEQGLLNANLRLQDIQKTLSPVATAFEKLGIQTKAAMGLAAQDLQLAFESAKNSGQASTESLAEGFKRAADAALASGDIQRQSWVRIHAATYGYQVAIDGAGKASLQLASDVLASNAQQQSATQQTTDQLKEQASVTGSVAAATKSATNSASAYKAVTYAMFDREVINNTEAYKNMIEAVRKEMDIFTGRDVRSFFREYNRFVDVYVTQVKRAQDATANLNEKIEDGTVNQQDLSRAIAATNVTLGRLDSITLNNLNEAIDKTRQKIQSMRDEAEGTRAQLEAELASIQGDESKREQLEQEAKLRELNAKLQEAEAAKNNQAIGDYRDAIKLQKQIYAEKQRQVQLEKDRAHQQAEAERVAAEQQAQQSQATNAPIDINIGEASVSLDSTANAAKQITDALQEAMNGRDQNLVDKTVNQLVGQIQDELKRGGR